MTSLRRAGLRTRLVLASGLAALVAVGVAAFAAYRIAHLQVLDAVHDRLRLRAERLAAELQFALTTLETSAHVLARDVTRHRHGRDELVELLTSRVLRNPDIHGALLQLADAGGATALYVGRRGGQLHVQPDADAVHAVPDAAGWSEPYFNEAAGGIDTISYRLPLRDEAGAAFGILRLDLSLDRAQTVIERARAAVREPDLLLVLVDRGGRVLLHPDPDAERVLSLAAPGLAPSIATAALHAPDTWPEPQEVAAGAGAARYSGWALGIAPTGWRLSLALPHAPDLAPLHAALWSWGSASVLVALAAVAGGYVVASGIRRPLVALSAAIAALADGRFDAPLPRMRSGDELGGAIAAFASTRERLHAQFEAQRIATDRDRRVAAELDIARGIQRAMAPKDRVYLGLHRMLSLAGMLLPARAVGGDFYHYFALDRGHVCFFVGDVSDKGVPSALFAARLHALVATHARQSDDPGLALQAAAAELYRDNDTGLFATVVLGVLQLDAGDCVIASAGHDAPLRIHPGGAREWLPVESGPALGFEDGGDYPCWRGTLRTGDRLLLFTDGVTEALNRERHMFGNERIEVALERREPRSAAQLASAIVDEVEAFAAGAEQADDITVLALALDEREA